MTTPAKNPGAAEPGEPLPLPGLVAAPASASDMTKAAHRTLTALEAAGLLDEQHALTAQLILELANVVTVSVRGGKASAAAMAAAQVLAALDSLTPDSSGGDPDEFDKFAAELREAAERGISAIRDGT